MTRPWAFLRAGAVVLLALGACGDPAGDPAGSRSAADAGPLEARTLATSPAIATVRDLEVLPDGRVWVLNSGEPLFVGFGPDGASIGAHGRLGGGPEDVRLPVGFVTGGIDGEVWAFDLGRHALLPVSEVDAGPRALPRESVPPGSITGGMNLLASTVRTASIGGSVILPRRAMSGEVDVFGAWASAWTADLVALDLETDSVRTVVPLSEVLGDPTQHFDPAGTALPIPLWYRLWAVCGDSEIRVYDRLENVVRGFALDGTELQPTELPPVRYTEVTPAQFAEVGFDIHVVEGIGEVGEGPPTLSAADSARILREMTAGLGDVDPEGLAGLLPRYVDYRCDEEGTQWIQPFDIESHGGIWASLAASTTWLRISPDGSIDEVDLPERFDPYRFTPERIWGVQRDELDVASIAWVEVPGR